jgi:hypothetical protein
VHVTGGSAAAAVHAPVIFSDQEARPAAPATTVSVPNARFGAGRPMPPRGDNDAKTSGSCVARRPARLLAWVSAATDRAASRPPRGPPRSASATAVMSERPVSLAWCLWSLAGAVCAGCRCLMGRGSAAGRLAPGLVRARLTARLCRGHRTAWHS